MSLGDDPETGLPVLALTGRYGPFVQLGEMEEGSKEKPKRESLLSTHDPDTVTLEDALRSSRCRASSASTPRARDRTAQNGRYGPYLKKGTDSRSLESRGADLHGDGRAGRGAVRPAQAPRRADEGADRRARHRTPRRARRSACSTADSVRTSPTARSTPRCPAASTRPRSISSRPSSCCASARRAARRRRRPRRRQADEEGDQEVEQEEGHQKPPTTTTRTVRKGTSKRAGRQEGCERRPSQSPARRPGSRPGPAPTPRTAAVGGPARARAGLVSPAEWSL